MDSLPTKLCQFDHGTGKICLKESSFCSCSVAAISFCRETPASQGTEEKRHVLRRYKYAYLIS
jgi:hypothetical protein